MEELAPLLNELAAQLGTTVDFLWGVLLYQAYISAIGHIVLYSIYLVLVPVSFRYVIPWLKLGYDREMKKDRYGRSVDLCVAGITTVGVLLFALTATVIGFIPDLITKLMNPEYWALQQILEVIR